MRPAGTRRAPHNKIKLPNHKYFCLFMTLRIRMSTYSPSITVSVSIAKGLMTQPNSQEGEAGKPWGAGFY